MIDWINMNMPYPRLILVSFAGDPPELAGRINEDLHLLFGGLVGVLDLGYGVTFEIGRRLNVEENIFSGVFSILKYHF